MFPAGSANEATGGEVQPAVELRMGKQFAGTLFRVPLPIEEGGCLWMLRDFLTGSGAFLQDLLYYTVTRNVTNSRGEELAKREAEISTQLMMVPKSWRRQRCIFTRFSEYLQRVFRSRSAAFWRKEMDRHKQSGRGSRTLEANLQVLHPSEQRQAQTRLHDHWDNWDPQLQSAIGYQKTQAW